MVLKHVIGGVFPSETWTASLTFTLGQKNSVREVRRTRRTCPANFQNVRRRAAVKFNQMSGEKFQMSGEAKKDFAYTEKIHAHSEFGLQP